MAENIYQPTPNNEYKEDAMHPSLISYPSNTPTTIVCKLIIRQQLSAILQQTPIALEGKDIEGVHKMRVGYRRLRTGLRIFKPIIKKGTYTYFQENLKNAGQILGEIRDLDVLHEDMMQNQDLLLEKYWQSTISPIYNQSREEFLSLLSSLQYTNLIAYLTAFVSEENSGVKSSPERFNKIPDIKEFSSYRLKIFLEKMLAYTNVFQSIQPYPVYHQLRKATKKFRYALEFFSPILIPAATEHLLLDLVSLQDHLGKLNDASVATDIFHSLLSSPFRVDNNIQPVNAYYKSRIEEKNHLTDTFLPTWEAFLDTSPRELLANCLP